MVAHHVEVREQPSDTAAGADGLEGFISEGAAQG